MRLNCACLAIFGFGTVALAPFAFAQLPDDSSRPTITVNEVRTGQDLRIVVYGDMRFTDPSEKTDTNPVVRKWLAERVAEEHPDALLVTGDIPYHGSNASDWEVFARETQVWRDMHLRVYPTVGNHEVVPVASTGYEHYFAAFPHLRNSRQYSVLMGNVYLISLDSCEPIWPTGSQADWFRQQMDHIPPQVDFVFVMVHVPMMADVQTQFIANVPSPEMLHMREWIEERAAHMRQKIVVVNGHIHNYERFDVKGIAHIISGGGGARPYPVFLPGPEDLYRGSSADVNFNYVVLKIHGTHADAEMYRVVDPSAKQLRVEVRDTFSLDARPAGEKEGK